MESKIPDITNMATKAALSTTTTEIVNKVPGTTSFITTPDFNRLTKISFDTKMEDSKLC